MSAPSSSPPSSPSSAPASAGRLLRAWRQRRGKSQLQLALDADVSTRHLSYLENGRSNPSREMVVHLCDVLEVPLRERNRILEAAGFARVYRETPMEDPAMEQVGRVIDLLLETRHPAGAVAVDWGWNVLKANRAMMATTATFADPALLGTAPLNVMDLIFAEQGMHRFIVNWDEVGPTLVNRLRRDADYDGRSESAELVERVLASPAVAHAWRRPEADGPAPLLVPLHLRRGDVELELFSTITTLGTPQDVTLQELRIETFHPMDPRTEATLRALCEAPEPA
jgi:transcriptional regulator with XRE-family HTH domain